VAARAEEGGDFSLAKMFGLPSNRGETELRAGPLDVVVTPEAEEFAASHGVRIVRAE
jgi:hypothetical protein